MLYFATVNGKKYEVLVERANAQDEVAPEIEAAPVAVDAPAADVGGSPVTSPVPGTVLEVLVAEGQSVREGQPLLILEAMKMENEINSPYSGVVKSIAVAKGSVVDTGALLISIG